MAVYHSFWHHFKCEHKFNSFLFHITVPIGMKGFYKLVHTCFFPNNLKYFLGRNNLKIINFKIPHEDKIIIQKFLLVSQPTKHKYSLSHGHIISLKYWPEQLINWFSFDTPGTISFFFYFFSNFLKWNIFNTSPNFLENF